jgi:serine/threonine-protein kinase
MCPVCGAAYGQETGFCARDGARTLDVEEASAVLADRDPLVRTLIGGRYRVLKRLGEGGMGVVYLAEHEAIEKRVAVKVLRDQYAQREDVVRRFQQEAKSASRIRHEGILEIFDFGRTEDGRFFLAMELLDGTDLAHILERENDVDPARTVRLGIRMARALYAAHQKGVIHRDMKPENVFVRVGDDGFERIKIVDFGIAQLRADGEKASDPEAPVKHRKLTKTGMIFGTPEYMSPEQAAGRGIDQRIDVYALGIILFEMLTGRTPYDGATFMAILSAHLMNPIPTLADFAPPGFHCSPDLEAVVRRALAKDPVQRFHTMNELAEALLLTPEGAMTEQRLSTEARSSQFPSGFGDGGANVPGTDYRMRSQRPPPQAHIITPLPGAPAPPAPYGPAQSQPPPPMPLGAGTIGGYVGGGSSARDVGAPTLMEEIPARTASTSAEAALLSPEPPKKSSSSPGVVIALAVVFLGVLGTGAYFGWRAFGDRSPSSASTSSATSSAQTNVASTTGATTTTKSANDDDDPASPSASITAQKSATVLHVAAVDGVVEKKVGNDWVQVCDQAPCDVSVDRGAIVSLRVNKKGVAGAEKKVLADHEQTLALAPVVANVVAKPKPSDEPLCEVMQDGIKILRPCKPQ